VAVLRPPGWPQVTVAVRYFAGARSAAGTGEESVVLPAPATLSRLTDELVLRHGEPLQRVLRVASFIVDEVATPGGTERDLVDGTRVDVLPPFAGG
jgi:molybdopterin synthase sulfur carrier subunit